MMRKRNLRPRSEGRGFFLRPPPSPRIGCFGPDGSNGGGTPAGDQPAKLDDSVRAGSVPSVKLSRRWLFDPEQLRGWLDNLHQQPGDA